MTDTSKLLSIATNPKTGMSFVLFIFVIGLSVYSIKVKKNKKVLTIIPVIIALALISNVRAESNDFTVTVKDSLGKGLANVPVKIYAKPINIEAAPAIKLDANGGKFLDGKTLMYAKLPFNGCTLDDMLNHLSEDESYYKYLSINYMMVYRNQYYPFYPFPMYRLPISEYESVQAGSV